MTSLRGVVWGAALGAAILSSPGQADFLSGAAKTGANAGATDYRKSRFAKGDDKSKHKLMSISTYEEFD